MDQRLSSSAADDLNLSELVQAIVGSGAPPNRLRQRKRFASQLLGQLSQETAVLSYRQDVLDDLLADRGLRQRLDELLPGLEALSDLASVPERFLPPGREALERIARRLAELELYVVTARNLLAALQPEGLHAAGMQRLRSELDRLTRSGGFVALESALPALRATLSSVKSVTIAVQVPVRTFRIRPGAPHGQSFAADIAAQHGISFPQLVELLRQRGFG
jgi:hypothetical protein